MSQEKAELSAEERGGDVPKEPKVEHQVVEVPVYTESKKTWRSFFWSSEFPGGILLLMGES